MSMDDLCWNCKKPLGYCECDKIRKPKKIKMTNKNKIKLSKPRRTKGTEKFFEGAGGTFGTGLTFTVKQKIKEKRG